MSTNQPDTEQQKDERLHRLTRHLDGGARDYNLSYSKLIRRVRLVLPLIALAIVAVLFTWPNFDSNTIQSEADAPLHDRRIGKNELLRPQFETTDKKRQPFSIYADRAIQGESNENLVILENPLASMTLNSGSEITAEANQGAYEQDTQRLLLQGDVSLRHDLGYILRTDQMHIDIDSEDVWSDLDVFVEGPEGQIEAKGLKLFGQDRKMIFIGPAKMTLKGL